jgi:hypothetical protein
MITSHVHSQRVNHYQYIVEFGVSKALSLPYKTKSPSMRHAAVYRPYYGMLRLLRRNTFARMQSRDIMGNYYQNNVK